MTASVSNDDDDEEDKRLLLSPFFVSKRSTRYPVAAREFMHPASSRLVLCARNPLSWGGQVPGTAGPREISPGLKSELIC
ncbi:hypothetical protein [Methanoregula sp.]|uniref:hypothetical protein n=1 Tax=Methanoregula sp. TaxID=2052170 RepID=UPI003BB03B5C